MFLRPTDEEIELIEKFHKLEFRQQELILESYDYEGETIMVAPAAGFYSSPNTGLNQIRIAYVLNEESLIKAVKILSEALKVYNAKS